MAAAYRGHMKVGILVFVLSMLLAGPGVAQENRASFSLTSTTAVAGFNFHYGNNSMAERAIDERVIDRLGLFDRSDDNSTGYSMSLDLENEDSDWSFEV